MKKIISGFLMRGLLAAWGGPVTLAVVYGILGAIGAVETLTPHEVCMGIFSVTLLAFIVSGITVIYQIERIPLLSAILIHAAALYLTYLLVYLLNDWIPRNMTAIGIFTLVFVIGFAVIWLCIYLTEKAKVKRINQKLNKGGAS